MHERDAQGEPLLLPSRKRCRVAVGKRAQAQRIEHLVGAGRPLGRCLLPAQQLVAHAFAEQLAVQILHDVPYASSAPSGRELLPLHAHGAAVLFHEAGEQLSQRALPGGIGAHHGDDLAGAAGEAHTVGHDPLAEGLAQPLDFEQRRHVRGRAGPFPGRCGQALEVRAAQPEGLDARGVEGDEFRRRERVGDAAVGEVDDAVGDAAQIVQAMLGQEHGLSLLLERAYQVAELLGGLVVEVGGGLVHDVEGRVDGLRGGDGHALAHAVRQQAHLLLEQGGDVQLACRPVHALDDQLVIEPVVLAPERDLARHLVREELAAGVLEHVARREPAFPRRDVVDLAPEQAHRPGQLAFVEGRHQAVDHAGQRALASARGPGEHHHLAGLDGQVHVLELGSGAFVGEGQVREFDGRRLRVVVRHHVAHPTTIKIEAIANPAMSAPSPIRMPCA